MRRAVLLCLLVPVQAAAQEAVVSVDTEAPTERVEAWRGRVSEAVDDRVELEAEALRETPAGTVGPGRLDVISAVESLLMRARASRAQLREGEALSVLAQAEAMVDRALDVPGIAAWYGEVQLAIAITAAQAGRQRLSEAALRRAASVDPSRVVQAAEARPDLVQLARAVRRARATAPRSHFEVRAAADGAEVWVDDVRLGPLPRDVELPVGPHLVRIDAPGHGSWASILQVREGERRSLDVTLSPLAPMRHARAAERAATAGEPEAVQSALARWDGAPRVRLVWPGPGEQDRALTQACDGERCGPLQRLDAESWPIRLRFDGEGGALAEDLGWLGRPLEVLPPQPVPWFERWELWVAVGGALAIGAAIAIGAGVEYAQRDPDIIVDVFVNPEDFEAP